MKKKLIVLIAILILSVTIDKNVHASLLEELGQELNQRNPPYPYVISVPIQTLPEGSVAIGVGEETYYFDKGNFYLMVMRLQKYVMVPPPIGAIVSSIPETYQLMLIEGASYYLYNGVFYKRVLEGFKVIYPPR